MGNNNICIHANIVDNYACYCHKERAGVAKCPIWMIYGTSDASNWHNKGDFTDNDWEGGCHWYEGGK
jgi:hypothetical protein